MQNSFSILITIILFATGCREQNADKARESTTPRTPVAVTSIRQGPIGNQLTFSGSSLYLKRNMISSPIPAFITGVYIRLGARVKKGDILYILESKERRALGSQLVDGDTTLSSFGKISIRAPFSGIISTLDKQQLGDYVLEGAQLCTLAETNSLAVQINVPFEYSSYTTPGKKCMIRLPAGKEIVAIITTPLVTMNALSQTQSILARPASTVYLPENLIVSVTIRTEQHANAILLPRESVLSDEMLSSFWVMKMINDSTAVKVPVQTGERTDSVVEILSPSFSASDRILLKGNYALPDTARVVVKHLK